MNPPPGFEWVRESRTTVLVRSNVRAWVVPLLVGAGESSPAYDARALPGGRGGSVVITVPESNHEARARVVVRAYRRGGLPARLMRDTYIGFRPRPFRELSVTETLRQRGAPVVETYGAAVRWRLPGIYRGWLATRYIAGASTAWEWASATPPAAARAAGFAAIGRAIRRLRECGGQHPDLNLNNILICAPAGTSEGPAVVLIDFDRAQLAVPMPAPSDADLPRLARSARKLDPDGIIVTAADLAALRAAYLEDAACV